MRFFLGYRNISSEVFSTSLGDENYKPPSNVSDLPLLPSKLLKLYSPKSEFYSDNPTSLSKESTFSGALHLEDKVQVLRRGFGGSPGKLVYMGKMCPYVTCDGACALVKDNSVPYI